MPDEHQQKAAELGFDLTKQFLTLAFGGIAFVVGLSFSTPDAVSTTLLWWAIGLFSASSIFGLLFLMKGVNHLSEKKSFDIYDKSLRCLSILQIVFVVVGVITLCPIVNHRPPPPSAVPAAKISTIEIHINGQSTLVYPIQPEKDVRVEFNGSNYTFYSKQPVANARQTP
jgi:membrane protein implicated in regulation of membrane protease activity